MAQTTFARSTEANVVLLEEKLRREFWHQLFFARFAGFTTEDDRGGLIPSGQPIEILRRFGEEGSDSVLIPLLRQLSGGGTYGDESTEGREEAISIYYQKAYINQIRHAVKVGGRMALQRVKKFDILAKARPLLSDWMARWHEYNFMMTFCNGYSPHVLAATSVGGYNLNSGQKVCHPNFYAAGSGLVSWDADDSTYEGLVEDAVTGVTDTATDHMSTSLLEDLRVIAIEKNIQPISVDGIDFIPFLIHPKQAKQLRADSNWINAQKDARIRGSNNPIFTGALGEYAGFVLFERHLVPSVEPNAGNGTVTFGYPVTMFGQAALTNHARKVGIIFGAQAIAHGWADGPFIEEEYQDLKNLKRVGVGAIVGSARADFKDNSTDSSKSAVVNQSSILVCTYSA